MAVRIRLKRVGRRHRAAYRVAVMDARASRDSKVIEEVGQYDPVGKDKQAEVRLNRERIEYWLSVGAQPSDTVRRLYEKMVAEEGEVSPPAAPATPEPTGAGEG